MTMILGKDTFNVVRYFTVCSGGLGLGDRETRPCCIESETRVWISICKFTDRLSASIHFAVTVRNADSRPSMALR